jgi:peptidoglycan/LPS O-acetylase OafA/YrhL
VQFLVLLFFLGLATGVVAKIKGNSFLVWFLIGFCLPGVGLIAALLHRWERQEPRRKCPNCGAVRPIADAVCTVCGEDLDWPEREDVVPARRA